MHYVFVYGTLKEGFANYGINGGRRVPGQFRTAVRYPLFILGRKHLPWLVDQPGHGEHVLGQLFQVDDSALQKMDVLEQVDEEGWYSRKQIQVQATDDATMDLVTAFVYFGASDRVANEHIHAGPLAEFTIEQNHAYQNAA